MAEQLTNMHLEEVKANKPQEALPGQGGEADQAAARQLKKQHEAAAKKLEARYWAEMAKVEDAYDAKVTRLQEVSVACGCDCAGRWRVCARGAEVRWRWLIGWVDAGLVEG